MTYTIWGGLLIMIIVEWPPKNHILAIKAPINCVLVKALNPKP